MRFLPALHQTLYRVAAISDQQHQSRSPRQVTGVAESLHVKRRSSHLKGRLVQGRGKSLGAIDLHVASRLQQRRIELGISQRQLAATLGLTFQQIHKYEQGKSRISAGRLYELGKVLGVPITFFIEGVADALTPAAPLPTGDPTDELGRREAIELFTAYRGISDPVLRRSLRELARALGSETNASTAKPSVIQSSTRRRLRTHRDGDAAKR